MAINITYGEGGYCESCDDTHPHPLNNIIEQIEVEDPQPSNTEQARTSALTKLRELGLTDEEIQALVG